jgi:hypothetical protein
MIFVLGTGNTTGDRGTKSIGPFKPEEQPVEVQIREPEPVNILTAWLGMRWLLTTRTIRSEGRLPSRGSSILWATYTSPYTRRSYSLLTIRTVIEAAMKSVYEWLKRGNRWTYTDFGME